MDVALVVIAGLFVLVVAWALVERIRERGRPPSVHVPVQDARAEVVAVAHAGDRIRAVRVLRERTGLGLREATDTVKRWLTEDGTPWR